MSGFLQPCVLEGRHVRLEPMRPEHADALAQAAADGELWRLWYTSVPEPGRMGEHVAHLLDRQAKGAFQPFVVRLRDTGDVVGQTCFCNADADNRRLEIGYTWYAARVQRTAVNTETKWLLLSQAFEAMSCIAVEFRTHRFNERSRAAILRLGARQDGVLRHHQQLPDGSFRDTMVYSIIAPEWPAVKNNLLHRLQRGPATEGDHRHG